MEYESHRGIIVTIYGHMQQGLTQVKVIVIMLYNSGCPCNIDEDYTYIFIPSIIGKDYYCDLAEHSGVGGRVSLHGPHWSAKQCDGVKSHCCK